jgi:hypothetical protein
MSAIRLLSSSVLALLLIGCSSGTSSGGPTLTPTITWATPTAVMVGTTLSATQLNATANTSGTFTYTPAAGTVLNTPGNITLSTTFTPSNNSYTTATATVTLVVNAVPPPLYTWSPVTIVAGGYVTGIVMHPGQQGLMYARTDVGGAYRYTTAQGRWAPLTDWVTRANSNYIGIESIGIDPSDTSRLYLAAGTYAESFGSNGAMLLSADQGATFTTVPLPIKLGSNDNGRNAGERLQVDPNLGTTLYFGSRLNGLYRSTDRGQTWAQVSSFPVTGTTSGVGVVFETFVKSSSSTGSATKTIYAGVSATGTGSDPQSLYVSNDAGVTWTAVPGAPTGLYVTHGVLGPDGKLYLTYGDQVGPSGLTTGKVYQYTLPSTGTPNGSWANITPPRANSYQGGYGAVTLDPSAPGTIMVSTLDHYYPVGDDLWRSNNYGQTWYSINTVGAVRDTSLSPWLTFGAASVTNTGNWVGSMQIDPFNSAHVVYGNGQGIMATTNMTASDNLSTPSNWTVAALGVEETVIEQLISPPSGPANLLSAIGDLGGFTHLSFTASPAAGAFSNPGFSTGTGIDFAQASPLNIVRVGYGTSPKFGAYSTNGGTSWTPFSANPTGTTNGAGSVAISANAATILWAPSDSGAATAYSTNNGATWTVCTGAPTQQAPIADRINPLIFYIYNAPSGTLSTSIDGGHTFAVTQTGLPTYGNLRAAYDAQGSLWLATNSGLYHTAHADTGTPLTSVGTVSSAWGVALGAAKPGTSTLTLFVGGTIGGVAGLFRSTDNAATWIRIDDAAHEYGYIDTLQADPRVFARVYLGTGGRGILYGDSPN